MKSLKLLTPTFNQNFSVFALTYINHFNLQPLNFKKNYSVGSAYRKDKPLSDIQSNKPIGNSDSKDTENKEEKPVELDLETYAKSLIQLREGGVFTTCVTDGDGTKPVPLWGNLMPYILLEGEEYPVFGVHPKERHFYNIKRMPDVSMVISAVTPPDFQNPHLIPIPAVNIVGDARPISPGDREECEAKFIKEHPKANLDQIKDYYWYQIDILSVYFQSLAERREAAQLLSVKQFIKTDADPIGGSARLLIHRLNEEHRDDIKLLCQEFCNLETIQSFIYFIDSFGFYVLAKKVESKSDLEWTRIRFPFPFAMKELKMCYDSILETFDTIKNKNTKK